MCLPLVCLLAELLLVLGEDVALLDQLEQQVIQALILGKLRHSLKELLAFNEY